MTQCSHQPAPALSSQKFSTRLLIIHFASLSVSLGTAVSALGRLALYLLALWLLLKDLCTDRSKANATPIPWRENWPWFTMAAVAYMALTVLWSEADSTKAILSWTRHARLLTIPIVWLLIRNPSEARVALRVFVITQLFVVASSWLLVWQLPVPWATAFNARSSNAVFGSYLEQSISEAIVVFMLWHGRAWLFGPRGRMLAIAAALATSVHLLGFLAGRTGHLVLLTLASLSVFYALPKKRRWMGVAAPLLLATVILGGFHTARERVVQVVGEVSAYARHADINSSSGERLFYWQTSLRSIADKPLLGSGSGGWNHELHRLAKPGDIVNFQTVDNPHQMFLLWAVEGGLIGLLLLCAVLLSLSLRSRSLAPQDARSLQSVLAALAVAGLTTSTLYGIGMGDFFCMAIGLLLATAHPAPSGSCTEPAAPLLP